MESLGNVCLKQDNIVDAVPLYKKSLKILEKDHGDDSAKLLPTLFVLGGIYEGEGAPSEGVKDYKTAIKFYDRAATIAENEPGKTSLVYADAEHRLGRATFLMWAAKSG